LLTDSEIINVSIIFIDIKTGEKPEICFLHKDLFNFPKFEKCNSRLSSYMTMKDYGVCNDISFFVFEIYFFSFSNTEKCELNTKV